MRKKCFKKTISLALCIVMSVTMTGTPVLADAFTDGSQSIISENAEIPTVDVESATNCGDVASTEENLTESALLSETEEKFDNPEYAEFSGGNDAEVVSEFSDNSVIDLTLMCTMSKLNLVQSIILRLMLLLCTKLGLIIKSVTCTK